MIKILIDICLKIVALIAFLFLGIDARAQQQKASSDNPLLQQFADADQAARRQSTIDWTKLNREDGERRAQILEFISRGEVRTAKDHFNVGVVFQHGSDSTASALAVESFAKALQLDSTLNRWWYAAAVDRDLMRRNKPQIYGTQYIKTAETDGKWKRYTVDTTQVTDAQRRYYTVGTLAEQAEKERLMNLQPAAACYSAANGIAKNRELLQAEFAKGSASRYNVSEAELNSLGYSLWREGKHDEALSIFQLNTELYPEAFNTFDSYGEILLDRGRLDEARKAYQRSLQLEPNNQQARKVLANELK